MPLILYQLTLALIRLLTGKRQLKLGQKLRNDARGSGHFGASRGSRPHYGIDIATNPGEIIFAPFTMYVERTSKANASTSTSGVRFIPGDLSDGTHGFIWYFEPYQSVIGRTVYEGEPLGVAQDIASEYGKGMTNHIHIEQWAGDTPINIESSYV